VVLPLDTLAVEVAPCTPEHTVKQLRSMSSIKVIEPIVEFRVGFLKGVV
jgi:hypothetical protein